MKPIFVKVIAFKPDEHSGGTEMLIPIEAIAYFKKTPHGGYDISLRKDYKQAIDFEIGSIQGRFNMAKIEILGD